MEFIQYKDVMSSHQFPRSFCFSVPKNIDALRVFNEYVIEVQQRLRSFEIFHVFSWFLIVDHILRDQ